MSDNGARPEYEGEQSAYGTRRPGDGSHGASSASGYGYGTGGPQDGVGLGYGSGGPGPGQAGYGPTQSSPIPPYNPPADNAPQWGRPAYGQAPYGQAPYGQTPYGQGPYVGGVEHPKAQRLRTMGIVAIPLSLFCGIFGLILGIVVLAQVGGVNREIIAQHLGGLDKTRQARVCAIVAVVLGALIMLGSASRTMNSYYLTH